MKFDLQKAFPYPVLRSCSDDYIESEFQAIADFEFVSLSNEINLMLTFDISCEEILNLIENGDARFVGVVSCRETYYRDVVTSAERTIKRTYSSGQLRGQVEVYSYVVATNDIAGYECSDINSEFGRGSFSFVKGEVLALDEPQAVFVGRELFKPISSVFDIVKDDNLSEAEWVLHFDGDHVQIAMGAKTKAEVDDARNGRKNKVVLINSLYFASCLQAIQTLRETHEYDDRIWAQVIRRQCHNKNIDLENKPAYEVANRLMRYPLALLGTYVFEDN